MILILAATYIGMMTVLLCTVHLLLYIWIGVVILFTYSNTLCCHCSYIPCASLLVRLKHIKESHSHMAKTNAAQAIGSIPRYNTGRS